jgi:predicted TPR repeat methyltransferase
MIDKASSKMLYTSLNLGNIREYLDGCQADSFDLVVAADVFSYIGDLRSIFQKVVLRINCDSITNNRLICSCNSVIKLTYSYSG